ncbi:MAG: hypothetical protein QM779_08745 [Propionicimonas sp.]|uniref:hypothetical protein n=1 Tax=Propionicimonas sp. TaxID=1955623 RepID=UPI003D127246
MADVSGELPAGILPMPELGEGVVGVRIAESARWLLWAKGVLWGLLAVVALVLAVQSLSSFFGFLLGLGITAACAFLATNNLVLARLGTRPALTVDADTVHSHVPLNRADIRLDAITRVERVRRDLLIEAKGGISRKGRPSRARWIGLSQMHTLEAKRPELVAYLSQRATASRAPR